MFYFQRLLILTSSWTIRAQKQYSAFRWINFPRGPGWSHQLSKCTNLKRQFFNLIEKLFAKLVLSIGCFAINHACIPISSIPFSCWSDSILHGAFLTVINEKITLISIHCVTWKDSGFYAARQTRNGFLLVIDTFEMHDQCLFPFDSSMFCCTCDKFITRKYKATS